MATTFQAKTKLTTEVCNNCGGVYALAEGYLERKRNEGGSWNCPYCDTSWRYSEPRVKQLEKQLALEESRHAQTRASRDHARRERDRKERQRRAEKAAKTRLKNKIARGDCPCCGLTFANVADHIAAQHPDFVLANDSEDSGDV